MKVTIDIDEEALVPKVLAQGIQQFEQDLEGYKSGNRFIAIFDIDPEKDKKEIKKHIKAFKRVMKYYSPPGDLIDAAIVAEVGIWGEK
jgi:hypothetical protein